MTLTPMKVTVPRNQRRRMAFKDAKAQAKRDRRAADLAYIKAYRERTTDTISRIISRGSHC